MAARSERQDIALLEALDRDRYWSPLALNFAHDLIGEALDRSFGALVHRFIGLLVHR